MRSDAVHFKENRVSCFPWLRSATFSQKNVVSGFAIVAVTWLLVNLHQSYRIRKVNIQVQSNDDQELRNPHSGKFEEMHDKWIIITTISQPTKDVEKLAKLEGWKVVVVGDRKTPENWSFPGCVFLDIRRQLTLGYSLTTRLPDNSYTRKNLGYLYAIQHGARYIYDTDDDNHPTSGQLNFRFGSEAMTGLLYDDASHAVMNPYAHFGQRSVWPRGYPLEAIEVPNSNAYRLTSFRVPAIQQGLVNGDPDLDAIFRLTRKEVSRGPINITFDPAAPPVALTEGVFAPFNSQNTFFAYDALWSLLLPSTVTFRVTDIWRGYWAQRLLWLLGQRLAFFPANAMQKRNAHDYLDDFRQENQFYQQTGALVSFLANWTCDRKSPEVTFFTCVRELSRDMAEAGFWGEMDAELVDAWLSDLRRVGYREPEMSAEPEVEAKTPGRENGLVAEDFHRVYFSANSPPDATEVQPSYDLNLFCGNVIDLSSINDTRSFPAPSVRRPFHDRLLVVVFNFPHFANLRLLDALYRHHFPNIVYCGQTGSYEQLERERPLPVKHQRPLSFINVTSAGGYFGYECAVRAMRMNYGVRGYVIVGDDVMFNFWNFHQLDPEVARLTVDSYRTIDLLQDPKKQRWNWWGSQWGQVPLQKALKEMEASDRKWTKEYVSNRFSSGLNMSNISLCLGDVYYVPRKVAPMFAEVMSVFLKHKVFLEIAIPTTVAGLHPTQRHLRGRLAGKSIWGGQRSKPFEHFNASADYLHPLKLTTVLKDQGARRDYCKHYVDHLLKNW